MTSLRTSLTESPPIQSDWIERRAKLFEVGDYPDKGISVSIEDLKALALNFDRAVPVLIEHATSPLELGYLTAVNQVGNELFGTVRLSPEADGLVQRCGARSLSLGLAPDLRSILEVSLVQNPRVADARLFGGEKWVFHAELDPIDFRAEYERLQKRSRLDEARRDVEVLVKAGKLCPAQIEFATALLASESVIEFSGNMRPIRELMKSLIERQPPMHLFTERVPATVNGDVDNSELLMMPEEVAFYRQHFPEVPLKEIARRR